MFTNKAFAALISALTFAVNGLVISNGRCPRNIAVKSNFDAEEYQGIWYEFEKFPTDYYEVNGKCSAAQYVLQDDGVVCVKNIAIDNNTGKEKFLYGLGVQYENAKLNFSFPGLDISTNYWVLDTDYNSYSVVYNCRALNRRSHSISLWILTRERIPAPSTVNLAENVLIRNGLSSRDLIRSDQDGCPIECENQIEDAK